MGYKLARICGWRRDQLLTFGVFAPNNPTIDLRDVDCSVLRIHLLVRRIIIISPQHEHSYFFRSMKSIMLHLSRMIFLLSRRQRRERERAREREGERGEERERARAREGEGDGERGR